MVGVLRGWRRWCRFSVVGPRGAAARAWGVLASLASASQPGRQSASQPSRFLFPNRTEGFCSDFIGRGDKSGDPYGERKNNAGHPAGRPSTRPDGPPFGRSSSWTASRRDSRAAVCPDARPSGRMAGRSKGSCLMIFPKLWKSRY